MPLDEARAVGRAEVALVGARDDVGRRARAVGLRGAGRAARAAAACRSWATARPAAARASTPVWMPSVPSATSTVGSCGAAVARAHREPAGRGGGRARSCRSGRRSEPSLPAAATSTAPSALDAVCATVSAEAPKAANGSASGARITSAWSERLPSPLGSSARSMPASSVAVVPMSAPCCISSTWIGTQRRGRGDAVQAARAAAPGDDPGHRRRVRGRGRGRAASVCGLPLIAFQPGARSCRYGCALSIGPSSSATVTPLPSPPRGRERARGAPERCQVPGHRRRRVETPHRDTRRRPRARRAAARSDRAGPSPRPR